MLIFEQMKYEKSIYVSSHAFLDQHMSNVKRFRAVIVRSLETLKNNRMSVQNLRKIFEFV